MRFVAFWMMALGMTMLAWLFVGLGVIVVTTFLAVPGRFTMPIMFTALLATFALVVATTYRSLWPRS